MLKYLIILILKIQQKDFQYLVTVALAAFWELVEQLRSIIL